MHRDCWSAPRNTLTYLLTYFFTADLTPRDIASTALIRYYACALLLHEFRDVISRCTRKTGYGRRSFAVSGLTLWLTHRWHWLSSVHSWRQCYSTALMKHCDSSIVTIYAVRTATPTQMYKYFWDRRTNLQVFFPSWFKIQRYLAKLFVRSACSKTSLILCYRWGCWSARWGWISWHEPSANLSPGLRTSSGSKAEDPHTAAARASQQGSIAVLAHSIAC